MREDSPSMAGRMVRDVISGVVVFLVALPLCLGVALASNAPELFSGILAGIVGGIVVGILSGSHTSVSGPAAGLTAIVAAQIAYLGSFEAFLLAVVIGGVIQIALGIARAGFLSAFVPSSVIKGLLAAIGVIIILKQIPYVLGHYADPLLAASKGSGHSNPFTELLKLTEGAFHPGALTIGLLSFGLLLFWDKVKILKKSVIPSPLVAVLLGVGLSLFFQRLGGDWAIGNKLLVQVPVAETVMGFFGFLKLPDFTQLTNPAVYTAGVTIAIVASLETLLNLEAVDKLDPKQRQSPPSRELLAQGVGNVVAGLIGGLPVTSVIVRSSVNLNAGAQSKCSAIIHGVLLLSCVMLLPTYLNMIPLSALAAILLATGIKLASPALVRQMWGEGRYQFIPFAVTLLAIVITDLLLGIMIGLAVSTSFILYSNTRRPIRRTVEKHLGGEVLHIELANQVSFLNRAALEKVLREAPRGSHILLDAQNTDYIDPDILSLIREFKEKTGPAHGVQVSLRGFRQKYFLEDEIQYVDCSTRELQERMTPAQVLQVLQEGNQRFRAGHRLTRDLERQRCAMAKSQHPLAVVLSCIDSRAPTELIFDLGLGDILSIRMAGNVVSHKVLGSMEFGCAMAGAKLIMVMGHTSCTAVTASVELVCTSQNTEQATGCYHLQSIVQVIQRSIDEPTCRRMAKATAEEKAAFVDQVTRENVHRTVEEILDRSPVLREMNREGSIAVVGAMYNVATGEIEFLERAGHEMFATLDGDRLPRLADA